MKKIKVSIIYTNYKSFRELKESIASIDKYKPKENYEIIVVDNEVNPEVEKYFKGKSNIKYIKASKNLGYAGGNNLGARYALGEYIYILNPDTKTVSNIIDNLTFFLDRNKDAAIAAPKLVDKEGKRIQQIAPKKLTPLRYIFTYTFMVKIFPKNKIKKEFLKEDTELNKPYEVEVIPGSAFLIRKDVFYKLGGFDERFFLYFEDNDICDRVIKTGCKIYKIPYTKVFHDWKPIEGEEKLKKIFEESRTLYFKKHFGFVSAMLVEVFSRTWWRK